MDVRITKRHVDMSGSFLEVAEERARKLNRYDPDLRAVDLLFVEDHGDVVTEARAEVPGRPPLVARAEAQDRRRSLDDTLRKLARQLRRERSRRVDHRAPPTLPKPD